VENYKNYKGEYTPEESLQIDEDKLADAKLKLTRNLNAYAREAYEEEVVRCEENIKKRTQFILDNKKEEWKQ